MKPTITSEALSMGFTPEAAALLGRSARATASVKRTRSMRAGAARTLAAAIASVPDLPRCVHGNAVVDGAGERLEPSCGCRHAPR